MIGNWYFIEIRHAATKTQHFLIILQKKKYYTRLRCSAHSLVIFCVCPQMHHNLFFKVFFCTYFLCFLIIALLCVYCICVASLHGHGCNCLIFMCARIREFVPQFFKRVKFETFLMCYVSCVLFLLIFFCVGLVFFFGVHKMSRRETTW